jgi:hypothetical protein
MHVLYWRRKIMLEEQPTLAGGHTVASRKHWG